MANWKQDASGNWQKTSDNKKNYTIVDGKKVEQTKAAKTPSATSSSTWNKDTVTLEEAKQQAKDVESGVIDVDKGTTSLELIEPKETISLEQAKQQTQTEVRPATDMSATKTTEYVNDVGNVVATKVENTAYVPIKAGSNIGHSDETVTTITKSGNVAVIDMVDNPKPQYTPELSVPVAAVPGMPTSNSLRDAALNLNASIDKETVMRDMGSSGTTSYMEISTEQRKAIQQEGMWDTVKIDTTGYKTKNTLTQSQEYATKIVTKGDSLVGKLVDTDVKVSKALHIDGVIAKTGISASDVKDFTAGAVVDNIAGAVAGLGAFATVVEATLKDPVRVGAGLGVGGAIMVKDLGSNLINSKTRARTTGQLVGAVLGEKVLVKGATIAGDEIRTFGRENIPVETLTTPEVVSGKARFPLAEKGTPIESIINDFSEAKNKYPQPELLPKHSDIIETSKAASSITKTIESRNYTATDIQKIKNIVDNEGVIDSSNNYGIHVSPRTLPNADITIKGASETPGLYVAPDASLHFAKIGGETKYKLFGESDSISNPTINFIQMGGIDRLPESLRGDLKGANDFMSNSAKKGVGYTTVKMEQGLKFKSMEKELVIPEGTPFIKDKASSKYYTRYKGRKLPVNVYRTFIEGVDNAELPGKGNTKNILDERYSYKYGNPIEKAIITDSSITQMISGSRAPKISQLRPHAEIVVPRVSQYNPKTSGYGPKSNSYTPKTDNYIPKTNNYLPKTSGYSPKSNSYIPKTDNYLPKTNIYIPKTSGYTPKFDEYTPFGGDFTPKRNKSSKKSKGQKIEWKYDRLYNTYGDATKWRGF